MDGVFRTWVAKGITTFYSITDRGKLKEFQTQEIHGLEKQDFYRYLQIRHYFDQTIKHHVDNDNPVIKEI